MKQFLIAVFALLSLSVFAEQSALKDSIFEDVDESLSDLSEIKPSEREYWRLTENEWARYEDLMEKSPWARWQHNASPLAILSHYAESMEEKRRYARLEAELDQWRHHVSVEFQTLYDQERAIVHARYVAAIGSRLPVIDNIRPNDKLQLYVKGGTCDARCRAIVGRVLGTAASVDIYVTNAPTEQDIFAWAESASIPIDRVRVKQVTLNFGGGVYTETARKLGISDPELPMLLKRTGSALQVIAI